MADVKLIFHVAVWIILSYSLFYNVTVIRVKNAPDVFTALLIYDGFGGKFKYLTFWYFVSKYLVVIGYLVFAQASWDCMF